MLVQSVDMGASSEPTIASETEELPVSGAEEDVSPLTEKWEIRIFAYQIPKSKTFWADFGVNYIKHIPLFDSSHTYVP